MNNQYNTHYSNQFNSQNQELIQSYNPMPIQNEMRNPPLIYSQPPIGNNQQNYFAQTQNQFPQNEVLEIPPQDCCPVQIPSVSLAQADVPQQKSKTSKYVAYVFLCIFFLVLLYILFNIIITITF